MAATRRLTEQVASAVARLEMPESQVRVALSGGADSATLAYLALDSGADVGLLHVHHGFPASDRLATAAQDIANELGLPLETVPVEVGPGPSPEDKARDARYAVFQGVDAAVVTGHTRDDSVETMLINLMRGTGIDGLAGIPYHRPPNVYRPMLSISRDETREIATLAGVPYFDDPMNDDLDLARNRVRRVILPRMRELNPRLDEAMARTAATLRADADFLNLAAGRAPGGDLPVGVVTTAPAALADRALRRWLEAHHVTVSADLVERVWSVVLGGSPLQDLEGGRRVVRDGAVLRVE